MVVEPTVAESNPALTGIDLVTSWKHVGNERHDFEVRCRMCGEDTHVTGLVDLARTFEPCDCAIASYTHLVQLLWHRSCLAKHDHERETAGQERKATSAEQRIRQARKAGLGWSAIARQLDDEGISPARAKCWSPGTVRAIAIRFELPRSQPAGQTGAEGR